MMDKAIFAEMPPYAATYLNAVASFRTPLQALQSNTQELYEFLASFPQERRLFRYEEGKWSVQDILLHLIDSERIFLYRALRFVRNDSTPLQGFDQDDYVAAAQADKYAWQDIEALFKTQRVATLAFFSYLQTADWDKKGTSSDLPFSVRGIAYAIAGHAAHHLNIIEERYSL
jgi:uncharacterized damage-inducible protein DinB